MNNLDGKTEVVGKLFSSDFFFKIPDYQRPFAWDEKNFKDLIDDLCSAQKEQQYFLGTLVLHKQDKQNYDVVDGQQRLTSLLILLAVLRDVIDDAGFKSDLQGKIVQGENRVDGVPEKARIEVKDRSLFREMVLSLGGTTKSKRAEDLAEPENRFLQAIHTFRERLSCMAQADLQNFTKFVNQKCVVIYLATSTFDDAFRLFTIVNDRGKQLRRIDILKAQNISPDVVVSVSIRERIAKDWEALENELGEGTLESVLHLMRMIYVKEKPHGDLFTEFENRVFKKGIVAKGERFVDEVKKFGEMYQRIFIERDYLPPDHCDFIKFKAMIYIMDAEFDASEWRACVLYFADKYRGVGLYGFILSIEKVYLNDWVSGTRKDERFGFYAKILRIIENSKTAEEALGQIKVDTSKIISYLGGQKFYGTNIAKYALLRLEVLASELVVCKEFSAKSIEHIFPQQPKAGSKWVLDANYAEHAKVVNSIGNLILLSKGKNSAASNHEFDVKKEKYLKARVSDYPQSVRIMSEDSWTIDKIKHRTEMLKSVFLDAP